MMRTLVHGFLLGLLVLVPGTAMAQTPGQVSKEIDCQALSERDFERLGEASITESMGEGGVAFLASLPPEKRLAVLRAVALEDLGCDAPVLETAPAPVSLPAVPVMAAAAETNPFKAIRGENVGFVATWTTIVWMFSALGFAVFMIWITSSKFRFQFRKMAEGEFEVNDKAMIILKERFARGEVTKEQFDKMRRDILN
jgi:uncharacterized membrane protein